MSSTAPLAIRSIPRFVWGVFGLIAYACGSSAVAGTFADEAEVYIEAWAEAWSSGDPYDTVAFYTPDVAISIAQPDLELTFPAGTWDSTTRGDGRTWLANWLERQTMPRERSVVGAFVDESSAAVLVVVDDLNTAAWYEWRVVERGISEQSTLRWRDAHKATGAPDGRLSGIDELIGRYLAAWDTGDAALLDDLYAPGAVVASYPVGGAELEEALAGSGDLRLPGAHLMQIAPGARAGPAIFVGRVDRGEPVAFVVEFADGAGCAQQWAVSMTVVDGVIAAERRLPGPETVRRCLPDAADGGGWWVGLDPPGPIETFQTGLLANYDDSPIVIINGTAELEGLLDWGLDRFALASLVPPRLDSATFGPVPLCDGRAGAVVESGEGSPDLVQCTDAYAACDPGPADCTSFRLSARFGMLHELAHVWIIQNVTGVSQTAYVARYELAGWDDREAPWHLRGVENAADMLVWGLIDEPVTLARIGDPPCAEIVEGWRLLAGVAPPTGCP